MTSDALTPEWAESIYHKATAVEYQKHQADYQPVNQRKVILAGYQAVIDAVLDQSNRDMATRYLADRA